MSHAQLNEKMNKDSESLREKINNCMCAAISAARYNTKGWLDTQIEQEDKIIALVADELRAIKEAGPEKFEIEHGFYSPSEQADLAPKLAWNKVIEMYTSLIDEAIGRLHDESKQL